MFQICVLPFVKKQNWKLNEIVFKNFFFLKKMYQCPNGYIVQMCTETVQNGDFTFFFDLNSIYINLFSLAVYCMLAPYKPICSISS